jgi:hypothetical protein
MIDSTKDILYLVIAFCLLWLTFFISWVIYYIAMILKEGKIMAQDVRKKFELVDRILNALKEKLEKSSGYMKLLVDGVSTVTQYIKIRKEKEDEKPKKGKKK